MEQLIVIRTTIGTNCVCFVVGSLGNITAPFHCIKTEESIVSTHTNCTKYHLYSSSPLHLYVFDHLPHMHNVSCLKMC